MSINFLCPLFKTKKSNRYLGLYQYNRLANLTRLPIIALGGINQSNLKLLRITKSKGFAAINFLKIKIIYEKNLNQEIQILINRYKQGDYKNVLKKCSTLLKKILEMIFYGIYRV